MSEENDLFADLESVLRELNFPALESYRETKEDLLVINEFSFEN